MAGGGEGGTPLEYTPTWIVAAVCSVIVMISLALERILHFLGKYLKRKNQKPLYEALQKVKEELMLLGFISLLLTVFQGLIGHMCIPERFTRHLLPCKRGELHEEQTSHYQSAFFHFPSVLGHGRRLLAEGSGSGHCARKGKVPLLSLEALHHLHIFIFVLAIVHVAFSVLTMILGGARIRQWKHWEDSIKKDKYDQDKGGNICAVVNKKVTHVHQHAFIRDHFLGIGFCSTILSWLHSFAKQFYASVTKSDYITLRLGFIMMHCRGNPKFDFHRYMIRALEADFKKVVGISWYLWIFVVIFLTLNVEGWHTYFWIAFLPLITSFGFDSCIMGQVRYIVPRLIIGVIIQLLCSYSTLPLYAIVTQMGSSFKRVIFEEHVQEGLVGWAQMAKKRKGVSKHPNPQDGPSQAISTHPSSMGLQLQKMGQKESIMEEGIAGPVIDPLIASKNSQTSAP
ncbi:MLO-like protein 1 isoform X3 [Magnolia sinica]|uniref:MLO-like protein 1 isoform X3 n=1 Tax=Magnolia sinica TaxID=86752 RepID=UPI00265B1AEA|nr:MLO-like protein 1 isoform X3 [Magnolia sinica]